MLIAVREDELLAEFISIPVMRSKVIGLCIGAFVAGLGGLLMGPVPDDPRAQPVHALRLRGHDRHGCRRRSGHVGGPVIGAVFLVYVPEAPELRQRVPPGDDGRAC